MRASKHTPAPWRVWGPPHECGDIGWADHPGIEADGGSIVIWGADGEEAGVRGATKDEALANAHLIAAAPEMLEMLHWAQTAADRLVECTPAGVLRTGIRAKADEMRALIARAEGR